MSSCARPAGASGSSPCTRRCWNCGNSAGSTAPSRGWSRSRRPAARRSWRPSRTVAFGVTVPKPLGDFLVLDAVYATGGTAIAISDEDILAAEREAAKLEGTFVCPEGAACFAAARQLAQAGWLSPEHSVVALNTGTGLKYPDTVAVAAPTALPSGALARYHPREGV